MEIGDGQKTRVEELVSLSSVSAMKFHRDLSGKERVFQGLVGSRDWQSI